MMLDPAQAQFSTLTREERRQAVRVSFFEPVIVSCRGAIVLGWGFDLSESGMAVYYSKEASISTGQRVRLKFTLPRCPRWISLEAVVVRRCRRDGRPLLGLRFNGPVSDIRRIIGNFIAANKA